MSIKRKYLVLILLAVSALLVLSGCAPRVGGGAVAEASVDDAKLVVDLPTLVWKWMRTARSPLAVLRWLILTTPSPPVWLRVCPSTPKW